MSRLAQWFEEAEALEVCIPPTREHEKAALIWEQFQANTTTPVTRTTADMEVDEQVPAQDITIQAESLANCGKLYAGELEKLARKKHDPPVWAAVFRQASKRTSKETLSGLRKLIWIQTMRFLADSPITALSTAISLPR